VDVVQTCTRILFYRLCRKMWSDVSSSSIICGFIMDTHHIHFQHYDFIEWLPSTIVAKMNVTLVYGDFDKNSVSRSESQHRAMDGKRARTHHPLLDVVRLISGNTARKKPQWPLSGFSLQLSTMERLLNCSCSR